MKPVKWYQTASFARLGDLQLEVEQKQIGEWAWHVWNTAGQQPTLGRGVSTSQAGARAAALRLVRKAVGEVPR